MRGPKYPIELAEQDRIALDKIIKKRTTTQQIAQRARIIVMRLSLAWMR